MREAVRTVAIVAALVGATISCAGSGEPVALPPTSPQNDVHVAGVDTALRQAQHRLS
jgi:hypothetical protein